ncbi:hypothetical protein DM02DRAFT_568822 [Periconia macrospinosa]|uniref:Aminoglycoside phosphotransferase domain-containing protein n=1 Tax=Periconia macrospinosa TaxID=97972 RepID=A0A2V1DI44_9PLEO|nr:hypothetical protein DM02DRAFT_568822 [Periconia macrospinosa]
MALPQTSSFWTRMGCGEDDQARDVCIEAIRRLYGEGYDVKEFTEQGWCSYTLLVSQRPTGTLEPTKRDLEELKESTAIVQIRPQRHSFDLDIAQEARATYGNLAPTFHHLPVSLPSNLAAFAMNVLPGVALSSKIPLNPVDTTPIAKRIKLISSLAITLARAWPPSPSSYSSSSPLPPTQKHHLRADSPLSLSSPSNPSWLTPCHGRVGSQIVPKLLKLATSLPSLALRARATQTLDAFLVVREDYPLVLNHGDLIPTNILVDAETWEVKGLVDWAEAEVLPFGVCAGYGVEWCLGGLVTSTPTSPTSTPPNDTKAWKVFQYSPDADFLREVFWKEMVRERPQIEERLEEVRIMGDVGVLLWHGFAWDEGRIDRVVEYGRDEGDVACLEAFLGV